jgi:hypothetical protein
MSPSPRRSSPWWSAIARGAEWRYLVLFVAALLVPTVVALMPLLHFLQELFDANPRSAELATSLDSSSLVDLVRQLGEPAGASSMMPAVHGALLVALLLAPVLSSLAAALASLDEGVRFGPLLARSADFYPRMLRIAFTSVLPLGVALALAALFFNLAEKSGASALTEASAERASLLSTLGAALLLWVANVTVEAGRAFLVADLERRSAWRAWWSGVKLTVRRPLQVFGRSLLTGALGFLLAAVITAVRVRVPQAGMGAVIFAFVLAQLAVAAIGWGRASRLAALVDVIREG